MRIIRLSPSSIAAPKPGCCHALLLPSNTGFRYQRLLALDLIQDRLRVDMHLELRQSSEHPIVNSWTSASAGWTDSTLYCCKIITDLSYFFRPDAYQNLLGSAFNYQLNDKEPPFLFDAYSYTSEDNYRKHLDREIPYERDLHGRLAQLLLSSP